MVIVSPMTPPPPVGSSNHRPTDDELRDRWIAGHPNTAYGLGEFRRYQDGYWPILPKDQVRAELSKTLEHAKSEGIRPSSSLLASVLELARVKLFRRDEVWDADPSLLVFRNGTLDLLTHMLRDHRPEDFITGALPYDFDEYATAPTWERFIASTIRDVACFVQEFAGYALTTDTKYEIALWLHGNAGSGKSTLIAGLQAALGPRVGLLGLADIEQSRFSLGDLPGKTLMIATEQPSLYLKASHVLNSLISGEPVRVERKFTDPFTFIPHIKLLWAMNELPRVHDANNGLFRRVKVIEFKPIPETQRDPDVKAAIQTEGAGILNWALEGLERLRRRGRFEVPQAIVDATTQFQQTNDVPKMFVDEMCYVNLDELDPNYDQFKAQSSALYSVYSAWCKDNGHKAQSSTSIADDWRRLGFVKKKDPAGNMMWFGVKLK